MTNQAQKIVTAETSNIQREAVVIAQTVQFNGLQFNVNHEVPAEACLKAPDHFYFPTKGRLRRDIHEFSVMMKGNANVWIYGPPGCGKDAVIKALSEYTRTPAKFYQVNKDSNIPSWFFRRGFKDGNTVDELKELLLAVRDGYKCDSGKIIPYWIIFSDFDRIDPREMENFRSMLESDGRTVTGPNGTRYPVLEGTRFIFTANSSGSGDERGKCVSTNAVDSSLMDRMDPIRFHPMHWDDEVHVLKNMYPEFVQWDEEGGHKSFECIGKIFGAIRRLLDSDSIDIELTMRTSISLLRHATLILKHDETKENLLRRAVRIALVDKTPDMDTSKELQTLAEPHLPELVVVEGDDIEPDVVIVDPKEEDKDEDS